ncbi:MAG: hypothetical protein EOM20_05380 [Spartobacteria bacterium]|nr:hypothetical protein [Spartobacteria bacterium]
MNVQVSIHDKYQVELKVGYPLHSEASRNTYELDLYMFAPRSLGVHPEMYTKQQFYSDMQTYIRLRTPPVPLNQLTAAGGLFERLHDVFIRISQRPSKEPPSDYENRIKLFCCVFKSAVRDYVAYIQDIECVEDRERLTREYITSVRAVAEAYRTLHAAIQTPGVGQPIHDLYCFGDEYISLLIDDYTCYLVDVLPASDLSGSMELRETLMAVVRDEIEYRRKRGYPSIPEKQNDNETLVFRRSILKKYVASILFLDTEVRKEGVLLEQTLFSLAAAVAMVFATAVAFISQSIYGALTLPVFVALVVSYIFKDRIKDLIRYYLSRKMSRFLFDHKTRIHDASRNVVGTCKESFEFIRECKLSTPVRQLRDRDHITEIENGWLGEQTLLYRKRIRLYPQKVKSIFPDHEIEGVNDIIRLSIQAFLRKMDDPKKELFVMDDDGFLPVKGTRVYHLNLIIRLAKNDTETLKRYRLVLTRKGIKRIEQVRN